MQGVAVDVTVVDDAVVGWLARVDLPGFQALMRAVSFLSSWWVLNGVLYALIIALLVLRRFRHLIIWLILTNPLALVGASILGPVAQRPRPFGVVIREGWGGWAMPSMHVTYLALGLVTLLYTLVPEGRLRNTGKWVVTALIALVALARIALGVDAPHRRACRGGPRGDGPAARRWRPARPRSRPRLPGSSASSPRQLAQALEQRSGGRLQLDP
jgi:hypothetical protein